MFSQRAIRRLRPDPIPDADIHLIIEAAQKAPNGGNQQPGRFVILKDRERIQQFGALYREAWWAKRHDAGIMGPEDISQENRTMQSAMRLADEIKDAPLIILACSMAPNTANSVFPPVQNLLLAARALGIGGTLTTLHPSVEGRVRELTGIPEDVEIHCCLPMGYPRGNFGPTKRKPANEIAYLERWGEAPGWGSID